MFDRPRCRSRAVGTRCLGAVARPMLVAAAFILSGTLVQTADPTSGTLAPSAGATLVWNGTSPGGVSPGPMTGDHHEFCAENVNCELFELTLSGTPADWSGLKARVLVRWHSVASDYDVYLHKGTPDGEIVDDSAEGLTNFEQVEIDPAAHGTGTFHIHVVYFSATDVDQYRATAIVLRKGVGLTPAPIDQGPPPRYQSHTPAQAQIAAGLTRNGQDEPNIGVNWTTGSVMFQALLQTIRVNFDDSSCPQTPASGWQDVSPATSVTSFDPILFTDHDTGRTFVSHLLLNPLASASSFTDTDGTAWTPSQGAGAGSGVDHQTLGGGPYAQSVASATGYPNAVYYCAQDIAFANCARSDDGGLTFGPAIPMYDINSCAGLHGHVKVAPDGTVYVPNAFCSGTINPSENGVAVSEDDGVTWTVRTVPGTVGGGGSDPSVASDTAGRLYLGFVDDDKNPAVAVSDDKGRTWKNVYDVGAMVGVNHAVFPAMVAGGPGRAAMAFYGTSSTANVNAFTGAATWYLYVAHTYDGGASWITVNATPNDPLQRGGIHLGGGGPIHRNLLDFFDADLDKQGRMVVGYADGCLGACVQTSDGVRGNSYTAYGTIARQTGGRGLFAEFDIGQTVPGAPRLTVTRNGSLTTLTWSQSETGGSPVSRYQIFRSGGSESEQLLASVEGSTTRFVDQSGDPRVTYTYRVSALNAIGESCGTNAVIAEPRGDSCAAPGITVMQDRLGDQAGEPADPDMDIEWVAIGEPYFADGSRRLVFTMKVRSLNPAPPDRMWRLIWRYPDAPVAPHPTSTSFAGRYYIGMNTDSAGVATFEYGMVRIASAVVADAAPPTRLGAALDAGTGFAPDGTITMVIDPDKVGGPKPGDLIGAVLARTYPVRQHQTLRGDTAADAAASTLTYALVGNAFCESPPKTINCFSESDASISYSNGWHTVSDPDAEGGRFRIKAGNGTGLSFDVDVPTSSTGTIAYHYATSKKGGSADVYIDGTFRETVSFAGDSGSLKDPTFGANRRYGGLEAGTHTFELRNVSGTAYVDGFCLESAFFTSSSTHGPASTTASAKIVSAGESLLESVLVPAGTEAIAIVASAPGSAVLQLALIDPAGAVLETVSGSNGVAVLERAISASGTYQVNVVNVGVEPADVWLAATPWGPR